MINFADRTIWTGDNLDILRGLNSASVDLIYLDPPFNSNRNYAAPVGRAAAGAAFKDTWTLSDLDVAWMGLIADEQPAMYQVLQAAGLTHGKGMQSYLCMMAVRLLEMRRVLKDTGSIYLHCDSTASHYLKLLMDSIYGGNSFQNEITWQRTESHNTAGRYGNITDTILFYTKSSDWVWNRVFHEQGGQLHSEQQMKRYRHFDADGRRYRLDDLTAPRPDSNSGKFEWRGTMPVPGRGWGYRLEQLEEWWAEGRIHTKRDGAPRMDGLKRYLDETEGKLLQNIWTDVSRIGNTSSERIGYPTQKPLALLERIIRASSNEGDVVLDPFCGCATACVAAENLGRRWIGIDISPKAVELVNMRLQQSMGDLFHNRLLPEPTSPGAPTSTHRCRTARTSTSCSASRRDVATGAAASSRSAISPLTTSFQDTAAAPTTSKIYNCCADTATASRATARRNTWWPGCGIWGSQRSCLQGGGHDHDGFGISRLHPIQRRKVPQ